MLGDNTMDMKELLADLHLELAKNLLEKVRNGEMDARLLKEARDFLKDNNIQYDEALQDSHMENLKSTVIEIPGMPQEIVEGFKIANG